jgi:hypothetical protein
MRGLAFCFIAMATGTIIAGLWPGEARACSGPLLTFEYLADTVRSSDVVAIGTLRGSDGATIGLDVEAYYKAPDGRPPRLIVNNLQQQGWPDCTSRPLRMRMYEDGTPVLAVLKTDDQGTGAHWRGALKQGGGIMPLRDGRVVLWKTSSDSYWVATRTEFDAEMAKIGALATKPDPATPPERPLAPTSPLTCMYDPPSIESLTTAATIVGIGVVTERTADIVTFRVDEPLKGATGPTTARVNNHYFAGGLSDCREEVSGSNRIMNDREPAFLFLVKDTSGGGADWRPVGIDAAGMFLWGDIPWPNAERTGPLNFEAVRAEVLKFAAVAPEAPTPSRAPPPASVTPDRDTSGDEPWLWTAVALVAVAAAIGGLVFRRLRRR